LARVAPALISSAIAVSRVRCYCGGNVITFNASNIRFHGVRSVRRVTVDIKICSRVVDRDRKGSICRNVGIRETEVSQLEAGKRGDSS